MVTNSRFVAKQIKSDKVENVAMESIVMDGVIIGNVGNPENSITDEEKKDQDEEKVCKSSIKGLARRNREKHAILAEVGEEEDQTTRHTHRRRHRHKNSVA